MYFNIIKTLQQRNKCEKTHIVGYLFSTSYCHSPITRAYRHIIGPSIQILNLQSTGIRRSQSQYFLRPPPLEPSMEGSTIDNYKNLHSQCKLFIGRLNAPKVINQSTWVQPACWFFYMQFLPVAIAAISNHCVLLAGKTLPRQNTIALRE